MTTPLIDHRLVQFTPHMDWVLRSIRPGRQPITTLFPWDSETFLIQPGHTAPKMVCLSSMIMRPSWDPAAGGTYAPTLLHANFDRDAVESLLRLALLDGQALHIGANTAFDMTVIGNEFPHLLEYIFRAYEEDRVVCVQLAERLIHNATNRLDGEYGPDGKWVKHGYSLADLARRYLNIELDKDTWRLKYGTLFDTPIERWDPDAVAYPLTDAIVPGAVFQWQLQGAEREYLTTPERVGPELTLLDLFRQSRAQFWIALMVARGFIVDPRTVARLKDLVERERDRVLSRLKEAGLVRANGQRDTKAAAARMVAVCAVRGVPVRMTSGGEKSEPKVALDEEVCTDSGDPLLADYASYTSLTNILSKDVGALEEPAVRGFPIQARFETLVHTGRLSSSGGKGKKASSTFGYQMHNVRKELGIDRIKELDEHIDEKIGVRQCFVPREGFILGSIDYSMFELHAWAQVSVYLGVPLHKLIDALNAGRDVHLALGARLLGIPYEEAVARKKEPVVKEARQASKAPNFGFPGGLGWRGFIAYAKSNYNLIRTETQAKADKENWREQWEPDAYFKVISRIVGDADMGELVHPISLRRRAWVKYTEAANGFFQSLAADAKKAAGFKLAKEMYLPGTELYGSRMVDEIHDEFLFEFPIHTAHEAAERATVVMLDEARVWMPDCPPRADPTLMWAWAKAAETVRDANGRLQPWVPKDNTIDYGRLFG